jgi:hypothetical protein
MRSWLVFLSILVAVVACGRDVTFVDPRAASEPGDSTDHDTTVVVRGNLDVSVTIAPQDTGVAGALGFGAVLAGAAVTARRVGQPVQQGTTDSAGRMAFADLVTGSWVVTAVRPLSADERATLPLGAEDVTAFAGGASASVAEAGSAVQIPAYAGRGGTIVFSELYPPNPLAADGNSYSTGGYIELVNNSFETVYLDGMIVGHTYHLSIESQVGTCQQTAPWREDSLGIWARFFASFPGRGTDYPLSPGAAVVIATDAINHTDFVSQLLDLSGADFEFIGSADVDNPAVPNMLNTGLAEWEPVTGHGLKFSYIRLNFFVASALDPDTLASTIAIPDWEHVLIPRASVLDVVTSRLTPEVQATLAGVLCERMIHPVFDRQHAELYDGRQLLAVRRRGLEATGRVLLQRTRNSAADFETGPPTPGRAP